MFKLFLSFTVGLLLQACLAQAMETTTEPPLPDVFNWIYEMPDKEHVLDCTNKAAMYAKALAKVGYEPRVALVKPKASYVEANMHCLVFDGVLWHDPTLALSNMTSLKDIGVLIGFIKPIGLEYHWEFITDPIEAYVYFKREIEPELKLHAEQEEKANAE